MRLLACWRVSLASLYCCQLPESLSWSYSRSWCWLWYIFFFIGHDIDADDADDDHDNDDAGNNHDVDYDGHVCFPKYVNNFQVFWDYFIHNVPREVVCQKCYVRSMLSQQCCITYSFNVHFLESFLTWRSCCFIFPMMTLYVIIRKMKQQLHVKNS